VHVWDIKTSKMASILTMMRAVMKHTKLTGEHIRVPSGSKYKDR